MRRQGARDAAQPASARVPADENAGVPAVARSAGARGPLALRAVNVDPQCVVTSPSWTELKRAPTTTATPRPRRPVNPLPNATPGTGARPRSLPRDFGRQHGGGAASCHQCRRSHPQKYGFSGFLASALCAGVGLRSTLIKKHPWHLGCLALKYPEQLASGECPACLGLCCGDECEEILCDAGARKRSRNGLVAPASAPPGPRTRVRRARSARGAASATSARTMPQVPPVRTRSASVAAAAASESAVNTPVASAGPLASPLLLPRPHMSHLQQPSAPRVGWEEEQDDDDVDMQRLVGPAPVPHDAWRTVDRWEPDATVAHLMLDQQLLYLPDGMRRGSLPELWGQLPAAAVPAASPGGVQRHALPLRLFSDSS